jgi:DNA-binding transcriptional MocR family regulator
MRQKSTWSPRIADVPGRLHERLAAAFAEDIIEQTIQDGARLPPHRDLAYDLQMSVDTVSKAYALLERQGLVRTEKGRATFAIGLPNKPAPMIDLSVNVPPRVVSDRILSTTLADVASKIQGDTFSSHVPPDGAVSHKIALANWASSSRVKINPEAMMLCNGAQHALAVTFGALCGRDSTILTEQLAYPGIATLARVLKLHLAGVALDQEGMLPSALEERLSDLKSRERKILYVTPTVHNPTARSMSLRRRNEIVRIARTFDLTIVEDDVYGILGEPDVPTLLKLAPERTVYVSGLSKTLTPGLRIGYLVCPPSLKDRIREVIAATAASPSPLSCLLMERWIVDGTAAHISSRIKLDAERRLALAAQTLNLRPPTRSSFHIFVPLSPLVAEDLASQALARGIRVTSPSIAFDASASPPAGIRLCLGAPSFEQLKFALSDVRDLMSRRHPITIPFVG